MKPHGHSLKKLIIFCFFLGNISGFANTVAPSIAPQGSKAFFADIDDLLSEVKTAEQLEEILKKIDLPNSAESGILTKGSNGRLKIGSSASGASGVYNSGKFAKYTKVDGWLKGITNATSRSNVENIIKNWSDDLLTKLENVPSRNPNFLSQVEANPSILNHFEEGSKTIFNKSPNLKAVELDMYAGDKARTSDFVMDQNGIYDINPTRKSFDNISNSSKMEINSQSGKIRDANGNVMTTDNVNSEGLMYVIDESGNIFIGGRNNASLPHPTLIGGKNPNVKCAGMIRFKDGRILEISNDSGHFKPSNSALDQAKKIFEQRLPQNSFDPNFELKYF